MSTAANQQPLQFKTLFGRRVWPANILRVYWPFYLSGTFTFFLFSYFHTKLMNSPEDKWINIVNNVRRDTERTKLKNAATQYFESHNLNERPKDAPAAHSHH
ncbi:hypothetical protein HK097_000787 [Rhizophlyctis rosea]|uniref:Uncharacterized protein n=1 Tax=Rhizophlyctis rosea TaxID=64517 RepID=A0AAD5SHY3_9FUNG|nr:hypothetical protein HK097_000787 [Rhizophlyctis rosea]